MFKRSMGIFGLVLSVSAFACSGAAPGNEGASNEDAVTSASDSTKVQGAWILQNDVTSVKAIVLNPDHTFFRANARVLNGIFLADAGPGPTLQRETGTWSLCAAKGTMTFNSSLGAETYSYKFTPVGVLNGIFLPGHEPKDKLELNHTPECKEGFACSQIAFPTQVYTRGPSYCLDASDCNSELASKIWTPVTENTGLISCEVNACDMRPQESPEAALEGAWGADQAILTVNNGKANIQFGCGLAAFDGFNFTDATSFAATGTNTPGNGVEFPPDHQPLPKPATFQGVLKNGVLTLSMTVDGNTSSMVFTKGRQVALIRCL
jgi:hypothetical protein